MNQHEYLALLNPVGPWHLGFIVPDGMVSFASFTKSQANEATQRIAERNRKENIYYQPNFVGRPPKEGKAAKEHITAVQALHVDCDPAAGEPWPEWRERCLKKLRSFVPAPSAIVDSGRGYQGIWLIERIALYNQDGTQNAVLVDDVESALRWLAVNLDGDLTVAHIAALLRLPGCTSYPNAKKVAKGFDKPLQTSVVEASGIRYSLGDFGQVRNSARPGISKVEVDAAQVADAAVLDRWDSTGRLKALAMHGHRIAEPPLNIEAPKDKDNSRSAWVFDFCCNALRFGVPEDIIAGCLKNRDFGISEHVLKQKNVRRCISHHLDNARRAVDKDVPPYTDYGNGVRFIKATDGLYRYCEELKQWLVYDAGRWKQDLGSIVAKRCQEIALTIATEEGDPKQVFHWASKSQGRDRLTAMEWAARPTLAVRMHELDADDWLLNCRNGVLDLRTGLFAMHDPADLMTKQAGAEYLPDAGCPRFLRFMSEITDGDSDLIAYMQRAIGYSLTGDTREQVFFLPYGGGANGKSTLLRVIVALLGDYAHTAHMSAFVSKEHGSDGPSEGLASMRGARLVVASEIKPGAPLDEQAVKTITGGEKIRARFLHANSFEYQPTFKVWLVVNHLPRIRSQDHGMWRRVKVLPFERVFAKEQQDATLAEKLIAEELSGVLNWALAGCRAWQEKGIGGSGRIDEATRIYKTESDVLVQWMEDELEIRPGFSTPVKQVRASYFDWCQRTGERPLPSRALSDTLVAKGFPSKPVKQFGVVERCFVGLRLKRGQGVKVVAETPAQGTLDGGHDREPF